MLGVSRSAYYAWTANRRSGPYAYKTAAHDRDLALIPQIHAGSCGTYGYRRVHAELRADGHMINRKRVARLMRLCDLSGADKRRRRGKPPRTARHAAPAPDLVRRDFTATSPDELPPVPRTPDLS